MEEYDSELVGLVKEKGSYSRDTSFRELDDLNYFSIPRQVPDEFETKELWHHLYFNDYIEIYPDSTGKAKAVLTKKGKERRDTKLLEMGFINMLKYIFSPHFITLNK
jgi:hypothetical protein